MDLSLDDEWDIVASGLADGVDVVGDRPVADSFLRVLEDWVRARVVRGDASDVARCRLQPRFRLLRDVHTAFDFLGEILLERLSQLTAGNLNDPGFRGLDRQEGMGRIAAGSWLELRARTFVRKQAARGMVGMPEANRDVVSLDAGEGGGLGDGVPSTAANGHGSVDPALSLVRALADGRPVLVPDLEAVTSTAIIATAGLQLRRRLDLSASSAVAACETADAAFVLTRSEVERTLDAAIIEHRERVESLQRRRWDHPNMSRRTSQDIDRQIAQATAAGLLWPIWGARVAAIFGLASENAGQQRVTKYRKALPAMLPDLAAILGRLGGEDAPSEEHA